MPSLNDLFRREETSPVERGAYGAGGLASILAGLGVVETGRGKSTPSMLDMVHQMFVGPEKGKILKELSKVDPEAAARVVDLAERKPIAFKALLLGFGDKNLSPEFSQALKTQAFERTPKRWAAGDVLLTGPADEMQGRMGRLSQALAGDYASHSHLVAPNKEMFTFTASGPEWNKAKDVRKWSTEDVIYRLKPKGTINEDLLAGAMDKAYGFVEGEPVKYNPALIRRQAAHEILGSINSQRTAPTIIEKIINKFYGEEVGRRATGAIPGARGLVQRFRTLPESRMCQGATCATAVAESLRDAGRADLLGRDPRGTVPADYLRQAGKNFEVASVSIPKALQSKKELILNHVLKHGPIASRLVPGAALVGGGAYLLGKAVGKE